MHRTLVGIIVGWRVPKAMDAIRNEIGRDAVPLEWPDAGSACDVARDLLGHLDLDMARAARVFTETADVGHPPFPTAFPETLKRLVAEINAVNDTKLVGDLRQAILDGTWSSSLGQKLAARLDALVAELRRKDRIAANVAALATAYACALARADAAHAEMSTPNDREREALMWVLGAHEDGALGAAPVPDHLKAVLCGLFGCDEGKLAAAAREYIAAAEE